MEVYNWEQIKDRKCHGACLQQVTLLDVKRVKDCKENCQLVKCPSYALCGFTGPEWYFGWHSDRCQQCNILFGNTLKIVEVTQDCPICLDEKTLFAQWGCPHLVCVDCFRITHGVTTEVKDGRILTIEEAQVEEEKVEEDDPDYSSSDEYKEIPKNLQVCPLCRHEERPHWMNGK